MVMRIEKKNLSAKYGFHIKALLPKLKKCLKEHINYVS